MLKGWAWAGGVPENSGGNWLNCSEGLHSKSRALGCLPGGQVPPVWKGWQGWRESGKDLQQTAGTSTRPQPYLPGEPLDQWPCPPCQGWLTAPLCGSCLVTGVNCWYTGLTFDF